MKTSIHFINGHWFAYTEDRILGPFTFKFQARNAARELEEEKRDLKRERREIA